MVAGVVVTKLRGKGEPVDDLDLCALELARALAHLGLEHLVLALDLQIQEPGLEQRADPEHDFIARERLVQKVFGPTRQRLALGLLRDVAGEHQDREVGCLDDLVERVHHCEAVEMRHVKVEQDEVRPVLEVHRDRVPRVAGREDASETAALEQTAQYFNAGWLVIHDQNSRFGELPSAHRVVGSALIMLSTAGDSGQARLGAPV